ncbi:MAG: hypothetical protein ACRCUY_13505 [Thermoguttaceae bacterium]
MYTKLLISLFIFAASTPLFAAEQSGNWYKGNLHMHSFWSDGNVFPEQAIDWYKDRGYNFVSLTDHSAMQNNPNNWRTVGEGNVSQELFDKYLEKYGKNWVEAREKDGKTQVRLKMFTEFIDKVNEPSKFIVIPGHEQNSGIHGRAVHDNVINVVNTMPFQMGTSVSDCFRRNADYLTQYSGETGRDVLMIANHPHWVYFDGYPQDYIEVPEIRFYEFLNCNPSYVPHEKFWDAEKFWDIVNAFRLENGLLPLYGVANDDTHNYLQTGAKTSDLGNYWSVVRAAELTPEKILQAMYKGDFYCSSGVEFETVDFDKETKTLSVKVKPEEGVKYTIRFNGTKKGFDKTTTEVEDPAGEKKPARKIPVYSDRIGEVFKTVDGTSASYKMADDDIYVRATVVSDKETTYIDKSGYEPKQQSAWTQPHK